VREGKLAIEDICIGCGDMLVICCHPLFHGGLCKVCKVRVQSWRGGVARTSLAC